MSDLPYKPHLLDGYQTVYIIEHNIYVSAIEQLGYYCQLVYWGQLHGIQGLCFVWGF